MEDPARATEAGFRSGVSRGEKVTAAVMHEASGQGAEGGDQAGMQEYYEMGRQFIESHQNLFYALAKDRSLKFEVGKGFKINLEKGVITLDVGDFKQWQEKGLTEWQIVWSVCHEIAHYLDLREDPQGMLANFEYIRQKARELAPKVIEIWKDKWGSVPPHLTQNAPDGSAGTSRSMTGVEAFIFEQLRRNVYNALDDIYVNRLVELFAAPFARDGSQYRQTTLLYRDYLFPTNPRQPGVAPQSDLDPADFAGLPKSAQLCDALLRRAMVPEQTVLVSDEVGKIHGSYRSEATRGLGLTIEREALQQATNPATKKARTATARYNYYREIIEPQFIELFLKDAENIPPPPPPGEGGGKGKKGEGPEGEPSPWDLPTEGSPDPIDEQTIKDFIKQKRDKDKKDAEKKKQEQRTPEQRAADAQREADNKLCAGKNVDPAAAHDYREIQSKVQEHIKAVSEVFENFIRDIEQRISLAWAEGFKSGKLNVERFIKKYGHMLVEGGEQYIPWSALDTYDRREFTSRLKLKPSRFRVRLVLDGSGSMDADKIKALKSVVVLLSESLSWFEATMNLRFKLKDPFVVDTEIRMFGDKTELVKKFAQGKPTSDDEWADRFAAFGKINGAWGGTRDNLPLSDISQNITPAYKEELEKGTTKDMVFEITDGGTQTQAETIDLIETLEKQHLTTRALLIGSPEGSYDAQIFAGTWGSRGESVPDISQLAGVMAKLLSGEISKVKAKIQYQGGDIEDLEDEEMDRASSGSKATSKTEDQATAERLRAEIAHAENPFAGNAE